jgi:hypothetical protein
LHFWDSKVGGATAPRRGRAKFQQKFMRDRIPQGVPCVFRAGQPQ